MREKQRVDVLLVERGLAPSRTKAHALILAGQVYAGQERVDKVGTLLSRDAELSVAEQERFVSRGGLKLEGALVTLDIDVAGRVCVDIGASTGGFTDCLLQRRAQKVYAVDVGQGQLAQKIASDARVVVMDRTNARYLKAADFPEPIELIAVDASFIGLGKLMPAIAAVLGPDGLLLALVKPQFEAGKEVARRSRGVIRDPEERSQAIAGARASIVAEGFDVLGECDSAVPGPKGNVERFILARSVRREP